MMCLIFSMFCQYFAMFFFFNVLMFCQYFQCFDNIINVSQYFQYYVNISNVSQYFQCYVNISNLSMVLDVFKTTHRQVNDSSALTSKAADSVQ